MASFVLVEAARRGIEADKRAGADPRAVSAGPPRPCAGRSGAPHPRAVSAVSAGGPPHPRACSAGPAHPRAVSAVSAGPAHPRAVSAVSAGGPAHPRVVSAVSVGGPSHPRAVTPLGDRVPPQRAFDNLPSGPPSMVQQARELHERHKREGAVIREVLRAWRPAVTHDRPSSTRRQREGGARVVAASGRDGSGERDDGSGSDGDGGGGGSDPPPPSFAPASDSGRRP